MNKPRFSLLFLFILAIAWLPNAHAQIMMTHPPGVYHPIPPGWEGVKAWCFDCHEFADGNPNWRWVNPQIETPYSGVKDVYYPPPGQTNMVKGDPPYNGPCEVCHTLTKYHCNTYECDGDPLTDDHAHHKGEYCDTCHEHFQVKMFFFEHPGAQSLATHLTDLKGPNFGTNYPPDGCEGCHEPGGSSKFKDGEEDLTNTTVCDECHSPGGAFPGAGGLYNSDIGAKANWDTGIYEADGTTLKSGKENWCLSCHDGEPGVTYTVSAPNIAGDNDQLVYGYRVSGHGIMDMDPPNQEYVECYQCHNLASMHIDGEQRTYRAIDDNYQEGYRLAYPLNVPRQGQGLVPDYDLCWRCHDSSGMFSQWYPMDTHFRNDLWDGLSSSSPNQHYTHLRGPDISPVPGVWDSDRDSFGDSAISCTACHSTHGTPTPAMIRHGELVGAIPSLDFRWYELDGITVTDDLDESYFGHMPGVAAGKGISDNHVCNGCHQLVSVKYYRIPLKVIEGTTIYIDRVWTTDSAGHLMRKFTPGQGMQVHTRFYVSGGPYRVSRNGAIYESSSPHKWTVPLPRYDDDPAVEGPHHKVWNVTVPGTAVPGQTARAHVVIWAFEGGTLVEKKAKIFTFWIE